MTQEIMEAGESMTHGETSTGEPKLPGEGTPRPVAEGRSRIGTETNPKPEPRRPYAYGRAVWKPAGGEAEEVNVVKGAYRGNDMVGISPGKATGEDVGIATKDVPVSELNFQDRVEYERQFEQLFRRKEFADVLSSDNPEEKREAHEMADILLNPKSELNQLKRAARYFKISKDELGDILEARNQDEYTISQVRDLPDDELPRRPDARTQAEGEEEKEATEAGEEALAKLVESAKMGEGLEAPQREEVLRNAVSATERLQKIAAKTAKISFVLLIIAIMLYCAILAKTAGTLQRGK